MHLFLDTYNNKAISLFNLSIMQMIISITGSILFLSVIILYLLLLQGKPLGEYAMGGKHKILPAKERVMCFIAILIQIFGIMVLLQGGDMINSGLTDKVVKIASFIFAAYMSLNVITNLASRSPKEKKVMTPLSFVAAVCFWITAINI